MRTGSPRDFPRRRTGKRGSRLGEMRPALSRVSCSRFPVRCMNAGVRVLGIDRFIGPAAFSSSSSLLTASQRAGVVQTAAPLASASSRVVNTIPRAVQQPKAGPSNLNSWAKKPQSVGVSAKKPGLGSNTAATQPRWKPASEPSRRLSGTSKDDPIAIDISDSDDDIVLKPVPSKPLPTVRPSPIAQTTPVRRKNAPIPPGALGAIRQNATQRASQVPPEPSPPALRHLHSATAQHRPLPYLRPLLGPGQARRPLRQPQCHRRNLPLWSPRRSPQAQSGGWAWGEQLWGIQTRSSSPSSLDRPSWFRLVSCTAAAGNHC